MSHSQTDPRSVVRIAIALTALKHKARDQSTAYGPSDSIPARSPVLFSSRNQEQWESRLADLCARARETSRRSSKPNAMPMKNVRLFLPYLGPRQLTRVEHPLVLSRLPTDASQAALTSDAPPPKKKSKKNPTKDQHDPEWSWDQSRVDWSHFLSSQYPSSPSLIAAHSSLKGALTAPNADPLSYASRITDAILRTLETTYHFLFSAPNQSLDSRTQTPLGAPSPTPT
ncbi:hypothetical protein EV363DRAFT_1490403 [Boletus edulis]|nr:hypothetical protein EV363DRAFT_1490403 [Boletus edulis]